MRRDLWELAARRARALLRQLLHALARWLIVRLTQYLAGPARPEETLRPGLYQVSGMAYTREPMGARLYVGLRTGDGRPIADEVSLVARQIRRDRRQQQ